MEIFKRRIIIRPPIYIYYDLEVGQPIRANKKIKVPKLANIDKDKLR